MKRLTTSMLLLTLAFVGCRGQRPPMDMNRHAAISPVARSVVLNTFTNVDASLLEDKSSGGMFDDDGTLERYSAEYRLPADTNGVFIFFRVEMDTRQEPPIVTFLSKGTGQTERVLQEEEFTPERKD